ncbi:hypothetical protein AK830_g5676 [Neonectria ditissima]|uniref:Uncharacterized protein n=1 Tax=Neonectria ditissima TaxID=78410 RepID=A0A0P7BKE7_9HYPO|nr:hypothetical protein AK830_g5676 [Neonectria ditissima]
MANQPEALPTRRPRHPSALLQPTPDADRIPPPPRPFRVYGGALAHGQAMYGWIRTCPAWSFPVEHTKSETSHARTRWTPYIAAESPFSTVGRLLPLLLETLTLFVFAGPENSVVEEDQFSHLSSYSKAPFIQSFHHPRQATTAAMAFQQAPSKKPRLSLQIKTACSPATKSSRSYAVDPRDPTAFNTLSNVYVTAIERSTPVHGEPITAINTLQAFTLNTPVEYQDPKFRVVTPYVASYPETPLTAHATSPRPLEIKYPSAMTATPPMSAGPVEPNAPKAFSFSVADVSANTAEQGKNGRSEPQTATRRHAPQSLAGLGLQPPYTHPRTLHSILRNSPLPPPSAAPPSSPRRQSRRLLEKAAKRVGYNNPLTQDIVTNTYTKSHIDLLVEEASPRSPPCAPMPPQTSLDLALAYLPNEIENGGQTPGPFEDMRRRMAGLGNNTPASPVGSGGIRKRKKKDKKRRWVWTIGQDDDEDEHAGGSIVALRAEGTKAFTADDIKTPLTAIPILQIPQMPDLKYLETPTPSIESNGSWSECHDVEMSDSSSCISEYDERGLTPNPMDLDLRTPIAPRRSHSLVQEVNRDTPVPPELMAHNGSFHHSPKRDTPVPACLL